jgi:hypothetical protein
LTLRQLVRAIEIMTSTGLVEVNVRRQLLVTSVYSRRSAPVSAAMNAVTSTQPATMDAHAHQRTAPSGILEDPGGWPVGLRV